MPPYRVAQMGVLRQMIHVRGPSDPIRFNGYLNGGLWRNLSAIAPNRVFGHPNRNDRKLYGHSDWMALSPEIHEETDSYFRIGGRHLVTLSLSPDSSAIWFERLNVYYV